MDTSQRIVLNAPLTELWGERGIVNATRAHFLGREQVHQLLQTGLVHFVVADVGHPLHWVPQSESHAFWKLEARLHIVESPDHPFDIETFSEGYAYVASEWRATGSTEAVIVLLEKHH